MLQSLHRQNEKKKKTIYTCSGSTATVLFSWLIICFVSTEKEKRHCTPGQPSPRQVEPPAHWSPDSNYASESASREGDCKKHCTPVQPSRTGSSTSAPVSHLTTWLIDSVCINNKKEEMPMHTMPVHPMVNLHENKEKTIKNDHLFVCWRPWPRQ